MEHRRDCFANALQSLSTDAFEEHGRRPVEDRAVQEVLAEFKDPETGRSVVRLGQIQGLKLDDGGCSSRWA